MHWSPWESAVQCTSGPEPGARALLAWLREEYPQGSSLGIFNCRPVAGTSTKSLHSEGRALDYKMPMENGRGSAIGREIVFRIGAHGAALGLQTAIYDRTIWSAKSPEGRPYTGASPHHDHLHIELTRQAGRSMTLTTFRSLLAGGGDRGSRGHDGHARPGTHTVAPGENLSGIARQHGTTVDELARINNIANPDVIHAGQVLQLPGGAGGDRTYTVKGGDTLSKIGERLGVDWRKLAADNGIADPDRIQVGMVLRF